MYYRIYSVGRAGRFIGVKECERDGDASAVDFARQVLDGFDLDIYENSPLGARFVRRLTTAKPRYP